MELTPIERRVLGSLIEKDRTTPDSYPLTTNALVSACNQKSSREPIMAVTVAEVDAAMLSLRELRLARTVRGDGHRSFKHRHIAHEYWQLDDGAIAVLAVILLRGPQSPGELRTRTERYVGFADNDEAEAAVRRLAGRDEPLVVNIGRDTGQSQDRWTHLLADESEPPPAAASSPLPTQAAGATAPSSAVASAASAASNIGSLRAEIAELRSLIERLYGELGIELSSDSDAPSSSNGDDQLD